MYKGEETIQPGGGVKVVAHHIEIVTFKVCMYTKNVGQYGTLFDFIVVLRSFNKSPVPVTYLNHTSPISYIRWDTNVSKVRIGCTRREKFKNFKPS